MIPNTPIPSRRATENSNQPTIPAGGQVTGFSLPVYQANGNGIHQSVEQVDILVVFSEAIYSLVMEKLLSNK